MGGWGEASTDIIQPISLLELTSENETILPFPFNFGTQIMFSSEKNSVSLALFMDVFHMKAVHSEITVWNSLATSFRC